MRPAAFALAILCVVAPAFARAGDVTLESVNFDNYLKTVGSQKGAKVVLVDAWATWCGPCKENFPHVVQMHQKYAKQGLAVVSLSLDDATEPKVLAEVKKFLVAQKATFPNLVLAEDPNDAFEKLKVGGVPAVFLYSGDGKEIHRFTGDDVDNPYTYDDVEKAVEALLAGKPVPATKK